MIHMCNKMKQKGLYKLNIYIYSTLSILNNKKYDKLI